MRDVVFGIWYLVFGFWKFFIGTEPFNLLIRLPESIMPVKKSALPFGIPFLSLVY